MQSVSLTSQFVLLLICAAIAGGAIAARSDAKPARQHSDQIVRVDRYRAAKQNASLPETKILEQHDDLLPTQNRTQAMILESENGHIPAGEEQVLKAKGYLKKSR